MHYTMLNSHIPIVDLRIEENYGWDHKAFVLITKSL